MLDKVISNNKKNKQFGLVNNVVPCKMRSSKEYGYALLFLQVK